MNLSSGNLNSKILIIGDYPDNEDFFDGTSFQGTNGRILFDLASTAGITRSECYTTYFFKIKMNESDMNLIYDLKSRKVRNSMLYSVALETLKTEISALNPNVIVTLGEVPFFALTNLTNIKKWRGSILSSSLLPGKKVIPTICVRTMHQRKVKGAKFDPYNYKHYITYDLMKVREQSGFPEIYLPERNIKIMPTYEGALTYLREITASKLPVSVDIEVINEQVTHISFAKTACDCMSINFVAKGENYFNPDQEANLWIKISEILESRDIEKILQNRNYDSSVLLRRYGIKLTNAQDTMIAAGILMPDFHKGLDFLTSIFTNEPYYKEEGKQHIKYGTTEDNFCIYNGRDSCVLHEIWPQLKEDLIKQGNWNTYVRQNSVVDVMLYMEERGNKVDISSLQATKAEMEKELEKLKLRIHELCGPSFNPNSPKQILHHLYEVKKLTPVKLKGKICTGAKALKKLSMNGCEEASLILKIRKLSKLVGTYLSAAFDADGRFRCNYNAVGTRQGRLSSSKNNFGTGTNLQNLPPLVKKLFISDYYPE